MPVCSNNTISRVYFYRADLYDSPELIVRVVKFVADAGCSLSASLNTFLLMFSSRGISYVKYEGSVRPRMHFARLNIY